MSTAHKIKAKPLINKKFKDKQFKMRVTESVLYKRERKKWTEKEMPDFVIQGRQFTLPYTFFCS